MPPPPSSAGVPMISMRPGQVRRVGLEAQGGAHCGHRDEIVPATVADLGQRVVFRQHRDGRALAAPAGGWWPGTQFQRRRPLVPPGGCASPGTPPGRWRNNIPGSSIPDGRGRPRDRSNSSCLETSIVELELAASASLDPASRLVMIRALLFAEGLDWVGLVCQIGVLDVMRVGAVSPRFRPASPAFYRHSRGSVPDSIDGMLDCARGEYA